MLKVYGTGLCPDCVECKFNESKGIEVVHPGKDGQSCGLDGKGC